MPSDHSNTIYEWSKDILKFLREIVQVEPTDQQKEALLAVQEMVWAKLVVNTSPDKATLPNKLQDLSRKFGVSIMAGVGTGKGAVAAWIIIWFFSCFPFPKGAAVGPSARQLRDNLWAELSKWHNASRVRDWFTWQSDKFFFKEQRGEQWFISARTANPRNSVDEQAETLAGLHEKFVLIIADEASGIPDPVFRPLESTLTRECNLAVLFFNPTRGKGFAYDTHFRERNEWLTFRWNAEESSLVTRESIDRLERKYGRDSNTFRIRVLGLPPVSGERVVIPWDWIVEAVDREVEPMSDDRLFYSLDVGAGGDDSVMLKRLGPRVYPLEVVSYDESNKLTDWACRQVLSGDPKMLFVDTIGWGWGVAGALREKLSRDIEVVSVNVSESAYDASRFYRLRDELWWRTRDEFEKGVISIPDDPLLMGDLNAPMYEDETGQIKVESKKQLLARGVQSPNRADALIQTNIFGSDLVRRIYRNNKPQRLKSSPSSWRTV